MADDYQYINLSGVIVPDTADILTGVETSYKDAFGSDIAVTPDTPQGVLITAEALARDEVVTNNAAVANQINPRLAGGVFLDALMAFTGLKRVAAARSVVTATLSGAASTIIPEGSKAQTSAGDVFETSEAVVIPASGTVNVAMRSVEYGPIPAGIGALNTVVDGIIGWETVTNAAAATLGAAVMSDAIARALRDNTLAFQGVSLAEAISSALFAVENVTSLSFRENYKRIPAGQIINVSNGATLSGTNWAMSTAAGTGAEGYIVVGTDPIAYARNGQSAPTVANPWPLAKYTTTANITLSGLGTQAGGDWSATMTAGDVVLVKNQSTASQNGVYVSAAGAWARISSMAAASVIMPPIDGLGLVQNSVFACVRGGTNTAVAGALLENKSSGADWNGATVVNVIEPTSGQTYPIRFQRPQEIPVTIQATIKNGTEAAVKTAIMAYVNGLVTGEDGFKIGKSVSPFELSAAINVYDPSIYVKKVEISPVSPFAWSTNEIPVSLAQIATTNESLILVVFA